MESIKIKISSIVKPDDLTIVYKEGNEGLYEIKTQIDEFLTRLRYFHDQRNEIEQTKIIFIHEDIAFNIFQNFIESIKTKEIDLNESNYSKYYYLSRKYLYKELELKINEFIQERPHIQALADELSTTQSTEEINYSKSGLDTSTADLSKEEIISKNLDACLANGSLNNLPLEKLNRILNSPSRVLKNHHVLYAFVREMIESKMKNEISKSDKENLFILPSCLDYCLMTNSEIEEILKITNSEKFLNLRNSKEKIKLMIDEEKKQSKICLELFERLDKLEMRVKELESKEEKQMKINNENQEKNFKIEKNESLLREKQESLASEQMYIKESIEKQMERSNINEKRLKFVEKNWEKLNEEISKQISQIEKIEKEIQQIKEEGNKKYDDIKVIMSKIINEQKSIKKNFEQNSKSEKKIVEDCQKGIFKFLSDKLYLFDSSNDEIKITGNSANNEDSRLFDIINPKKANICWHSKETENSYVKIEFKTILVNIKKYRLLLGSSSGSGTLRNCVMKGINEEGQEIVLDEIANNDLSEIIKSIKNDSFVRSIQITMKGLNNWSDYVLRIKNIEFYGFIKTNKKL